MLRNAAQRPENNANPSGLSEKIFIAYRVCDFVRKVEISLHKKNNFAAIFIGFAEQLFVSAACTKLKNTFKSFGTIRKNSFG